MAPRGWSSWLVASVLGVGSFVSTARAVRLELHYESLCKQCQIHQGAIDDIVLHSGDESSLLDAGVLAHLEMSIDYYGTKDCEAVANRTHSEHGPDMCVADRYHLCAQQLGGANGTGAGQLWWPFTHCMFMNIDQFKCGVNSHCPTRQQFNAALTAAVPMCASVSGMNSDAIISCAQSEAGIQLADASYARTAKTLVDGFAPVYIDGQKIQGADNIWRKTPDNVLYGTTVLRGICQALHADANVQLPPACTNVSRSVSAVGQ